MSTINDEDVIFIKCVKKFSMTPVVPTCPVPTCPVCVDDIETGVIASCGHVYCVTCYCKTLTRAVGNYNQRSQQCPVCRANWDKPQQVKFMETGTTTEQFKAKGAFV